MKKISKVVVLVLIIALSLSGCGGENKTSKPSFTPTPTDSKEVSAESLEQDYVVVLITYIGYSYFTAEAPWQNSIKYIIHCELDDEYCIGDYVEVTYEDIYELEENEYEIDAINVSASEYIAEGDTDYKPVIYLYPTEETEVDVKLEYSGNLLATSPKYEDGWTVKAYPDGRLATSDGKIYNYLFWEGQREMSYSQKEGFCVKGTDTEAFLNEKLMYMGLSEQEIKDFVHFWLPYMKENPYNLISFVGEEYSKYAKLTISPKPDSILRVYMIFSPEKEFISIPEQKLKTFSRSGFTVVEWGGTIQ